MNLKNHFRHNPDFKIIFFVIFLCFLPFSAAAHPHMFFSCTAEFIWEGEKLKGVYQEWTLDQFFSADIIRAYDRDMDGKFNTAENRDVYNNAFINLRHYYFYTFIRQGKTRTSPPSVSEFTASQKNNLLVYRFYVDLTQFDSSQELFIAVYDYTFFCDIAYPEKDPIRLVHNSSIVHPKYEIVENKNFPVYYNPIGAIDDTTIYYEWKPGLQTYYPREIRIYYEK
ncbi:DUF1007 family protein [Brucepastera parasyntrophica]|uniref:DUF1007 family protein n=1 Tax=Brucepastera parasyntrophica TaxID=2880008 RepID=UPI00210E63EE|nr:DUF1007 family protein [Brucepastera parasyntrophica]ULQ58686.1 DUF1007 family protein [Brucepastera parasyntrophica]